jgi:hypothetical protein
VSNVQQVIDGSYAFVPAPSHCALRISQNVVRQPEGRALFAVAAGSVDVIGNFFSSQGFHGATTPPDATAIGDVVFIQNLGKPWEAQTGSKPLQMANFRQPSFAKPYFENNLDSVYHYQHGTLFLSGDGGHVLFNDNQVVYDWQVQRLPSTFLSYFAVALVSLDHVGVHNNQFAFRMNLDLQPTPPPVIPPPNPWGDDRPPSPFTAELLLSNVFAMGATVHVTGNRVSEALEDTDSALLSILSYGILLNTTALNQTSRCIAAFNRQFGDPINGAKNKDMMRFRIESLNLQMISEPVPAEEDPDNPASASTAPLTPCHAFYTGSIWGVMNELTSLLFDKRVV